MVSFLYYNTIIAMNQQSPRNNFVQHTLYEVIRKLIIIDSIDKTEALRYLGYGNNIPGESINNLINSCEFELLNVIKPRYLFQDFEVEKIESGLLLKNTKLLLQGQDIENHLLGCKKIVLLCVTISVEVDRLIRVSQIRDMTKALILDSLASVAVESYNFV